MKLLQHDFRKRVQHEKIPKDTIFAEQNGTCKYGKRMEDENKSYCIMYTVYGKKKRWLHRDKEWLKLQNTEKMCSNCYTNKQLFHK